MATRITGAKAAGENLRRQLTSLVERQARYAAFQALNDTVYDASMRMRKLMPNYIDRPTPYTARQVLYEKAKYEGVKTGDLVASVYIPYEWGNKSGRPAAKYLQWQVYGGARVPKGFEEKLRAVGILLGGEFAIPASGLKLDEYGNVPRSFINLMLSYFNAAESRAGYTANMSARTRRRVIGVRKAGTKVKPKDMIGPGFSPYAVKDGRYQFGTTIGDVKRVGGQQYGRLFIGGRSSPSDAGRRVSRTRHFKPGIYSAKGIGGSDITPLFVFTRQPVYKVRFPFHKLVEQIAPRILRAAFAKRFAEAAATMRPA